MKINGRHFLDTFHADGNYILNRGMLPSKKVYREIIESLEQRTNRR